MICAVGGMVLSLLANAVADAQPALRELENRLNRLLAPPSESTETPSDPRAATAEPGYAGFFADNAGTGVRGALVTSINSGGPAEAAGLKTGDLIASANGKPINTIDDLSGVLGGTNAGDTVELNVRRDGITHKLTLKLTPRPTSGADRDAPPRPESLLPEPAGADRGTGTERGTLGVRVVPVDEEARRRYGISVRRGAVIQALTTGGPAQAAGLQVGSVIVSIDGRRVDTPDDLVGYIRTADAGQRVEIDYYRGNELRRTQVQLGRPSASVFTRPTSPPRTSTPLPGPIFDDDRPALRKIESVIDRLVAPAPSGVPVAPSSETVDLRNQVEALQRQVEAMRRQIAELERRLAESERD